MAINDELRAALKDHDWFFQYSDDHRVWKKGKAQRAHIDALMEQVELPERAQLWNEHAPKGFFRMKEDGSWDKENTGE